MFKITLANYYKLINYPIVLGIAAALTYDHVPHQWQWLDLTVASFCGVTIIALYFSLHWNSK